MEARKFDSDLMRREGADTEAFARDAEMLRRITELNQDLGKERYRTKYWELAQKLAAANTGEVLLVQDDYALWLTGYVEDYDYIKEEKTTEPTYEIYGYNSQNYGVCAVKVDRVIMLHQANLIARKMAGDNAMLMTQAAELGYPSNLCFICRKNNAGSSCQTWIIGSSNAPRLRDCYIGDPQSKEYYECWTQLMPCEVIATWRKNCISSPHYFELKLYIDSATVPECLSSLAEPVSSSGTLVCLNIDSDMLRLNSEKQRALRSFFTTAQLECLGGLQLSIEYACRGVVDPIRGEPSPDIAGGWLGMLGIIQTVAISEPVMAPPDPKPVKKMRGTKNVISNKPSTTRQG